jgi:hypothetical protein
VPDEADSGRHEEQGEVPEQDLGGPADALRGPPAREQDREEKEEAQHRAGHGQLQQASDELSGELAAEEDAERADHPAMLPPPLRRAGKAHDAARHDSAIGAD